MTPTLPALRSWLKWGTKLRLAMGEDGPDPTAVELPGLRFHQNEPERLAFLRAIANRPYDDAPRLIMADWLDENGEHDTAARMRTFIQAHRTNDYDTLRQHAQQRGLEGPNASQHRELGVQELWKKHGSTGESMFNSLFHRILRDKFPVDWEDVRRQGLNADDIRRHSEGVHLANELMSVGALSPRAHEDVYRMANNVTNAIGYHATPRLRTSHKFAHLEGIQNGMVAAGEQAIRTADLAYRDPMYPQRSNAYGLTFPSHFYGRMASNHASAADPNVSQYQSYQSPLYEPVYTHNQHANHAVGATLAAQPIWDSLPGTGEHKPSPEALEHIDSGNAVANSTRERYSMPFARLREFVRSAIQLAREGEVEKPVKEYTDTSSFTRPEKNFLEGTINRTRDEYEQHVSQATKPKSDPFGGNVPHVNTLVTMAQLGSPAKGEYENTYRAVKQLFGHDPDGVTAWLGLNGIFSPNTSYKDHAGAASMLTAAWLNAGKPRDEYSIKHLIHAVDTFGKQYSAELAAQSPWQTNPETGKYMGIQPGSGDSFGGTMRANRNIDGTVHLLQNLDKLREALEDPTGKAGENLAMLGGGGTSKVPNFVLSYGQPLFGTAIDTHMARLMLHPSLDSFKAHSDILRQVRAHLTRPGDLDRIEQKSLKGMPVKSELVRVLMRQPSLNIKTGKVGSRLGGAAPSDTMTVSDWMKSLNMKMMEKPQHYLAYKHTINEAAKKLGWTPSEVQESMWTGVLGLLAANSVGIPHKEIMQHLTHDALRKGWQNHEAIYFPKLVDALTRGGANKTTLRKLGKRLYANAAENSRPGIVRISNESDIPRIAAHLPGASARSAARPIIHALTQRLTEYGLIDPATGKYRLKREGEPLRLMAKYDQPLGFGPVQDRVESSNQTALVEGLKQALMQSGVIPHTVTPAIHDFAGNARASIVAIGQYAGASTPRTAAAWMGLLGRQPGMLAFKGDPRGKDSIYHFTHHNADIVRNVLQEAGIHSRTIVPEKTHYSVYVYDPGNTHREAMARALSQMRATCVEWRGTGETLGGDMKDMGRSQYRGVINASEGGQQPAKMARVNSDAAGVFGAMANDNNHMDTGRWGVLADALRDSGYQALPDTLMHLFHEGHQVWWPDKTHPSGEGGQVTVDPHGYMYPNEGIHDYSKLSESHSAGPMNISFVQGQSRPLRGSGTPWTPFYTMRVHHADHSKAAIAQVHLNEDEYNNVLSEMDKPPENPDQV